MNELQRYVFVYHAHLMTAQEVEANRVIFGESKSKGMPDGSPLKSFYRERFGTSDPEVRRLVEKGREQFVEDVVARILNEQQDQIVWNHCPYCGALARTPTASQCPKCFFRWQDTVH